MIEHATMAQFAADRRTTLVKAPLRPGSTNLYTMAVLVLWHEPATMENRHTRPDVWRCLVLEGAVNWRPVILFASDLFAVEVRTDGGELRPFPPIDLTVPVSRTDPRPLAESACLAARDRLRVEFSYRKDGHPIEQRAGVAVGVRDDLLFVEDTARAGQLRSFRLDRIAALRCVGAVPTWDGTNYTTPRAWTGSDPFAGFGDGEEA
jgi:hypothetical protein